MKKTLIPALRILALVGLCLALLGAWIFVENRPVTEDAEFIFVGTQQDADCVIILSGDFCVLVDTGEAADAPQILEILSQRGITQIDCMILTHPDSDHVGGAAQILESVSVREVITPYFAGDKAVYDALINLLQSVRIPVYTISRDRIFTFGDLTLMLFPPEEFYYTKTNDYSLAILAEHGDVTIFMAGDAEKKRINELLELDLPEDVSLYKVSHHGRYCSESVSLIEKLSPAYAVVTSDQADDEILQALEDSGSEVFYTVGHTVSFLSDGHIIVPKA